MGDNNYDPDFNGKIELDLNSIEPSVAGPKTSDKISLKDVPSVFKKVDMKLLIKLIKIKFWVLLLLRLQAVLILLIQV